MATTLDSNLPNHISGSITGVNEDGVTFEVDVNIPLADIGRCIRMTSGSSLGEFRRIVARPAARIITVDFPFSISPWRAFIRSNGSRWPITNVAVNDTFNLSHSFDDIATASSDITKTDNYYKIDPTEIITLGANIFIHGENKFLDYSWRMITAHNSSCWATGYANPNGTDPNALPYAENGCAIRLRDDGLMGNNGRWGDVHMYGYKIIGETDLQSGNPMFLRFYRSNAQKARFFSGVAEGYFAMRLRGETSLILDVDFVGGETTNDLLLEKFNATYSGSSFFGLVKGVRGFGVQGLLYNWFDQSRNSIVTDVEITEASDYAIFNNGWSIAGNYTFEWSGLDVDLVLAALADDAHFIISKGGNSNGVKANIITNPLSFNLQDTDSNALMRSAKVTVLGNQPSFTAVTTETSNGIVAPRKYLLERFVLSSSAANYDFGQAGNVANQNSRFDYSVVVDGFLPVYKSTNLRRPTSITEIAIPDTERTELNPATVDAYTTLETAEKLYDYASRQKFLNPLLPAIHQDYFTKSGNTLTSSLEIVAFCGGGSPNRTFSLSGNDVYFCVGGESGDVFSGNLISSRGITLAQREASVNSIRVDGYVEAQSITNPFLFDTLPTAEQRQGVPSLQDFAGTLEIQSDEIAAGQRSFLFLGDVSANRTRTIRNRSSGNLVIIGREIGSIQSTSNITLNNIGSGTITYEPLPLVQPVFATITGLPTTDITLRGYDASDNTIPQTGDRLVFSSKDTDNETDDDGNLVFRSPNNTGDGSVYTGKVITGLGSTITRILLVATDMFHRTYTAYHDVDNTVSVQGNTATNTEMSVSNIFNEAENIGELEGTPPVVCTLFMDDDGYKKPRFTIDGHSYVTTPPGTPAKGSQNNAAHAACRNSDEYNEAIYRGLAHTYYPIPTRDGDQRNWDILNFPNRNEVQIRAGHYGTGGANMNIQLVIGFQEVEDTAERQLAPVTQAEKDRFLTPIRKACRAISLNSVRLDEVGEGDDDFTVYSEPPGVSQESEDRAVTAITTHVDNAVAHIPTGNTDPTDRTTAVSVGYELGPNRAWDLKDFVSSEWVANPSTRVSVTGGSRLNITTTEDLENGEFITFTYEQSNQFTRALTDDDFLVFVLTGSGNWNFNFRFFSGTTQNPVSLGSVTPQRAELATGPKQVDIDLSALENSQPTRLEMTIQPNGALPTGTKVVIHEIKVGEPQVAEEVDVPTTEDIATAVDTKLEPRFAAIPSGGSGGGLTAAQNDKLNAIDNKTDAIAGLPTTVTPAIDIQPILDAIGLIPTTAVDTQPILDAVAAIPTNLVNLQPVLDAIAAIPSTGGGTATVDLQPVLDAIAGVATAAQIANAVWTRTERELSTQFPTPPTAADVATAVWGAETRALTTQFPLVPTAVQIAAEMAPRFTTLDGKVDAVKEVVDDTKVIARDNESDLTGLNTLVARHTTALADIKRVVDNIPAALVDLQPALDAIAAIPSVNLQPVLDAIEALPEATDLTDVLTNIAAVLTAVETADGKLDTADGKLDELIDSSNAPSLVLGDDPVVNLTDFTMSEWAAASPNGLFSLAFQDGGASLRIQNTSDAIVNNHRETFTYTPSTPFTRALTDDDTVSLFISTRGGTQILNWQVAVIFYRGQTSVGAAVITARNLTAAHKLVHLVVHDETTTGGTGTDRIPDRMDVRITNLNASTGGGLLRIHEITVGETQVNRKATASSGSGLTDAQNAKLNDIDDKVADVKGVVENELSGNAGIYDGIRGVNTAIGFQTGLMNTANRNIATMDEKVDDIADDVDTANEKLTRLDARPEFEATDLSAITAALGIIATDLMNVEDKADDILLDITALPMEATDLTDVLTALASVQLAVEDIQQHGSGVPVSLARKYEEQFNYLSQLGESNLLNTTNSKLPANRQTVNPLRLAATPDPDTPTPSAPTWCDYYAFALDGQGQLSVVKTGVFADAIDPMLEHGATYNAEEDRINLEETAEENSSVRRITIPASVMTRWAANNEGYFGGQYDTSAYSLWQTIIGWDTLNDAIWLHNTNHSSSTVRTEIELWFVDGTRLDAPYPPDSNTGFHAIGAGWLGVHGAQIWVDGTAIRSASSTVTPDAREAEIGGQSRDDGTGHTYDFDRYVRNIILARPKAGVTPTEEQRTALLEWLSENTHRTVADFPS